jgi:hypothetical protein
MLSDLWQKFVDPVHWNEAQSRFPLEPWRYYLLPEGENEPEKWDYFQKAALWVCETAGQKRGARSESLTLKELLQIHSLVMRGNADLWERSLRQDRSIFNVRTKAEIRRVFPEGGTQYDNPDGLNLRVEGYWPSGKQSLDFFSSCRELANAKSSEAWEVAYSKFRSLLYPAVTDEAERWQVYFLTRRSDLEAQLQQVLDWYARRATDLLSGKAIVATQVKEVAVKMQRYLDIAQFCMDGSGRTSKLISDYVFLRFGMVPPAPVLYEAYGRAWENGTYLPLREALEAVRSSNET